MVAAREAQIRADFSRAVLEPADWEAFYADLGGLEVPGLAGLIWDGNDIDRSNADAFLQFILRQPHLAELSLAEANTPEAPSLLEGLSPLRRLTLLSVSCDRHESLGKAIVRPLVALVTNNPIEAIDVTGQEIGEDGLLQIIAAAPALRELRFRYFGVSSGDALIAVCEKVLALPNLTFATFPIRDLKPAMTKSNVARRPEIVRQLGQLRQRFLERFGREADSGEEGEEVRFLTSGPPSSRQANPRSIPTLEATQTVVAQNIETMKFFAEYDEETLATIVECGQVTGVDPMWRAYVAAMNAIEIPALARALQA
jgi:hypothetical protein